MSATGDREDSAVEPRTEEQSAADTADVAGGDEGQKSPEELQQDIKETREDLGETVDALSQKADVKAQVSGTVDEQKEKLQAKQDEIKEKLSSMGGGASGDAGDRVKDVMTQLGTRTSERPLPYLGGAAAVGVLLGLVLRGRKS